MARFLKALSVIALASPTLMQVPCTYADHGFSVIPNGIIPNPFAGLLGALGL